MYTDAGKKGVGVVLIDSQGYETKIARGRKEVPFRTYNEGELRAIEEGMLECILREEYEVEAYTDSNIARIYFHNCNKKHTHTHLLSIQTRINALKKWFKVFKLTYVRGKDNKADELTK